MDLGDAFQWAAGENAEGIMLSELRREYGQAMAEKIEAMASFSLWDLWADGGVASGFMTEFVNVGDMYPRYFMNHTLS